ncbi:hypothetical protein ABDK00_000795 [Niabella insulamsoli]|uniref:hypothetical protein n=1 Tax=Niabella insulamsoli TaxID=3144874 RepID=UPI0031FDBB34
MKNLSLLFQLFVCLLGAGCFILFSSCKRNDVGKDMQAPIDPIITEIGIPSGSPVSAHIGTAGGSLTSSDGGLTVSIPQGALTSSTTISIQPITNKGPLGLGAGYRLSPENVTFDKPVALIFHYDNALTNIIPEDFLWVITQNKDRSWNAALKSVVDKNANTVTVATHHFSDWSLGRFIDLSLTPASKTLKKGESVTLQVAGFARQDNAAEVELAPLGTITNTGDILAPLTPIPANEAQLKDFRVKGWTLNGAAAPVSNNSGSLTASGWSAIYKAPNQKPSKNPVAVSVSLESSDKNGKKSAYMLTSNISIVEADLYLLLKVDGVPYEYYQYGFNGAIPPDPSNLSIANCGIEDGILSIAGTQVENNSTLLSGFALSVKNPRVGTTALQCLQEKGQDEASFNLGSRQTNYEITRTIRTKRAGGNCDVQFGCANFSITLIDYENTLMGRVAGFFSGVLYEDQPGASDNCDNPVQHTVEGEFWLMRAN